MYIALTHLQGPTGDESLREFEASQKSCREAEGFRWSMLLRSSDDMARLISASMWLAPEHEQAWRDANNAPVPTHRYDVSMARGSMTPAVAAAIVDWQPEEAEAGRFSARWNAAYHAIESVIGSRLLQDIEAPSNYTGLHVVTDPDRLDSKILGGELTDEEGLSITPAAVERFEVLLLTETS